jgi:NAD(P)-dependent dehydrogenase (short-subunit alcohol dehydrogenase family)
MSFRLEKAVIITGSAGGIGSAIVRAFREAGILTIGLDQSRETLSDHFIEVDLQELVNSAAEQTRLQAALANLLDGMGLAGLINNAACQVIGCTDKISVSDFRRSLDINTTAPFLLTQLCLEPLERSHGTIVNISSIHAQLTKPGFVAYATSKGALETLTRALAVDLGSRIRVMGIAPAAINTAMLRDGFRDHPELLQQLAEFHPTYSIGEPADIAHLCRFLLLEAPDFLNGSVIPMDGGIGSKLHDPQ